MRIVPAYAKLNLGLAVLGRRPDGYHDIDSLVVRIDWHDVVGVEAAPHAGLRVTGGPAPEGAENLAYQAAALLEKQSGRALRVWLHKRLPAEAGLGGGSADAAAVLAAGCGELGRSLPGGVEGLGSDIPALVGSLPARIHGRGEILTQVSIPRLDCVVVVAGRSATAAAYAATTADCFETGDRISALCTALAAGRDATEHMGSGLEPGALAAAPRLADAVARLRAQLPGERWHLTGSGGALFAVQPDAQAASAVAARLRAEGWQARACHTVAE